MNRAFGLAVAHRAESACGLVPNPKFARLFSTTVALARVPGCEWPRGQSALAAASTSSAWPSTFTFSQTSATLPSGPIR